RIDVRAWEVFLWIRLIVCDLAIYDLFVLPPRTTWWFCRTQSVIVLLYEYCVLFQGYLRPGSLAELVELTVIYLEMIYPKLSVAPCSSSVLDD
ncbi:hypothetical protein GWI33_016485, partial [Rhynchophorus ferrugineus]